METLWDTVKALKLWQIGALAAVFVAAVGGTFGVYALVNSSGNASLGEDQQPITVQYGDLINEVSTNGSVTFPNKETLVFGTQGTVGEVLVEEGQRVQAGQPLVGLDAATMASLEKAVVQARINLRNAEDALIKAEDPHTFLDMAQAEAEVVNAKLAVTNAQDTLDTARSGPTAEDIAKAQSQIDSDVVALANAQRDLKLTRKEWDAKEETAHGAFVDSREDYKNVFNKWLGIALSDGEASRTPDTLLNSWHIDLDELYDSNSRFYDLGKWTDTQGAPVDDLSTPWSETLVYTWLNFYTGTIAPTCDDGVVALRGVCIQKEMDDAWDIFQKINDNVDTVQIQEAKAVSNGESAVSRAEDSLTTAREALDNLLEGLDPLEVDVKQKQLAVAKAKLAMAEEDLAELMGTVDSLEVALWKAEFSSAKLALDTALQRLDGATLVAPLDGIVSRVNVDAGQTVNANTSVIEFVDPSVVEIDGIVDEIDVLFVREGQRATVTMDALQGQDLRGTISSIASAATNQQGVVSYPIRVLVEVPEGVQLLEGLSATAKIILREENNVLLLPQQALYGTFDQPYVRILLNGRIEERPVVLGNSDDFWVVVQQGLAEGEQVVVETQRASTSQFGFRPGGGFPGGGFGGGRGFQGGGGGQRR